jgi:hypothetical protein
MLLAYPINSRILLGLGMLVKYSTIQSSAGVLVTARNKEGQLIHGGTQSTTPYCIWVGMQRVAKRGQKTLEIFYIPIQIVMVLASILSIA